MAAADFSALMNDISSITPAPESTAPVTTPDAPVEDLDETVVPESTDEKTTPEGEKTEETDKPEDKTSDGRSAPAKVRAALKSFRDAAPENAPIARELNDAYGRDQARREIFPTIAEMKQFKAEWDGVGGTEAIANLQAIVADVNQTDENLYAGKRETIEAIFEDMKANNHPEALGKLTPHVLDVLEKNDAAAYERTLNPRHLKFLDAVNFPGMVNGLAKSLAGVVGAEKANELIAEMARFYNDFKKENAAAANVNPEKEAWEKERDESRKNETTTFQKSVADTCVNHSKSAILAALKPYVKGNAYFKGWSERMVNNMSNDVLRETFSQLKAHTAYQAQMNAMWSQAKPDRAKIEAYHKSIVDLIAPRIAKEVLDRDYSGYTKKGGSKGTPTPVTTDKKETPKGAPAVQTTASYVAVAPDFNDIDWSKDPSRNLFVTDKAYLKKTGKFVTWAKPKR